MKRFSLPCLAVLLSLMLSASAFAGDIYIGKDDPPPPPNSCSVTTPGEIHIPGDSFGGSATQSDPVSDIALGLLQGLLSVF